MKKQVKKKIGLKKDFVYSTSEMKHYLGALSETHNEHLKGIKEGFIIVNKNINDVKVILNQHTEIIGSLAEDVSVLKDDVSTLKGDMVTVKEDLSVIKGDLKRKVDYEDFLSLVRRVQKIESKI